MAVAHTTDAECVETLRAIAEHGSNRQAGQALGVDAATIKRRRLAAEKRHLTAETKTLSREDRLHIANLQLKRDLLAMTKEADSAERIRTEIYNLASRTPEPPKWLTPAKTAKGSRGVPCTIWSDWHYGEVVRKEEIGGVNEFNAEIAAARITALVNATIDLAFNHMGRAEKNYPGIVVMLGGDMLSGDIHEELFATNDRTTQQCINDLTDLIASALERMADTFGRVFVPCVVGNHGRASRKPRMKGRVYCVTTDTPILTRDLRWVPAGSLKVGDGLLAAEEHQTAIRGRRWETATVTHAQKKMAPTIRIETDAGTVLYATPEHKFIAHGGRHNSEARWISAAEMLKQEDSTRKNKGRWKLDRFLNVWSDDQTRCAGYLSGVFDGEGTLSVKTSVRGYTRAQLCMTQYNNACLAETKRCLQALGFSYTESIVLNVHNKNCHYLTLRGGLPEVLRFLGQVRPPRLLAKWAQADAAERYMMKIAGEKIVSVTDGGIREIMELSSSSRTYITAGCISHNTSHEYNIYCSLERHFRRDDRIRFLIPGETDAYFKVYDHRFLLTHGDSLGVKGGDGIIGAIGPITRGSFKVARSEAQIGRDFDTIVMGHWHQMLWLPGGIVNGALKGYDEYARLAMRAPYSRPSQALWFVHPTQGITARWEIYLDDRQDAEESNTWVQWQAVPN